MHVIDLVPEEHQSPGIQKRVALIQAMNAAIEEVVNAAYYTGTQLVDLAILIVQEADADEFSITPLDKGEARTFMNAHMPHPDAKEYKGFDDLPNGFVTVIMITNDHGVTVTALGKFTKTNVPTPDSPNN